MYCTTKWLYMSQKGTTVSPNTIKYYQSHACLCAQWANKKQPHWVALHAMQLYVQKCLHYTDSIATSASSPCPMHAVRIMWIWSQFSAANSRHDTFPPWRDGVPYRLYAISAHSRRDCDSYDIATKCSQLQVFKRNNVPRIMSESTKDKYPDRRYCSHWL